MYTRI